MARRTGLLFLLLAIEWIPLSAVIHTKRGGASTARFLVAFGALFLIFGYARMRQSEIRPELERVSGPVGWRFFAAHVFALLVFLFISLYIKPEGHTAVAAAVVTAAWFAAGLGAIGLVSITDDCRGGYGPSKTAGVCSSDRSRFRASAPALIAADLLSVRGRKR